MISLALIFIVTPKPPPRKVVIAPVRLPASTPCLRSHRSIALVAARNSALRRCPLLLKKGNSRWVMVKVMCCQSQSGRIWLCWATHCSVALKPQELQAFDLQFWQKKWEWVQSGDEQQKCRTPISVIQQASMCSTQRRDQGLTLAPCLSRNRFQPSSTVKSNFVGRGILYMRRV